MAETPSTMLPLGTALVPFSLPDLDSRLVAAADFRDRAGLLLMFICNHCPFVKHLEPELVRLAKEYQGRGIGVVAISSNDARTHPDDGPAEMAKTAKTAGFTFPYLFDESQAVAKAHRASCTPDFFLFNREGKLVYRGQFDGSRPGNRVPVTGRDLRNALEALLAGQPISATQTPSIGCNIKWKPGNEPDYFRRR